MTRRVASSLKVVAGLATFALALFHGVLLWARIADGSLLEVKIALEWAAGLVLLAALMRLRRLGMPLHRGRAAIILWLLVSLLHAVAVVPGQSGALEFEVDRQLLLALPFGVVAGAVAVHLLSALRSLGGIVPPRSERAFPLRLRVPGLNPGLWSVAGCRAPPA